MIAHTNALINRMNIPQPRPIFRIIARRKAEYMLRQIPEEARVCVTCHDARRGDYLGPVDGPVGAGENGVRCVGGGGGGRDGCGVEKFRV